MASSVSETVFCGNFHSAFNYLALGSAVINHNSAFCNLGAVLFKPVAGGIGGDGYVNKVTLFYVLAVKDGIKSAFKFGKTAYGLVQVKTVNGPAGLLVCLG